MLSGSRTAWSTSPSVPLPVGMCNSIAASVTAMAKTPSDSMISRSKWWRRICLSSGSTVASDSGSAILQQRLDIGPDLLGPGRRGIASDRLAAAVDQELGEVPFDRARAHQARRLVLE